MTEVGRLVVAGSGGFIGRVLVAGAAARGLETVSVVRPGGHAPAGQPTVDVTDTARLSDVMRGAAVVNLGGAPIVARRWTPARKQLLRESRVDATQVLAGVARQAPAAAFVCASAVGYYGDRGDDSVDESAARGPGFLAELCGEWEAAAASAMPVRTAIARLGLVVGSGGIVRAMVYPFPFAWSPWSLGLGAIPGSGRQWMPWVALDDVVRALLKLATDDTCSGVYNVTAPSACRADEFADAVARQFGRRARLHIPAMLMRLMLGEASGMLLTGVRALPRRLEEAGFVFGQDKADTAIGEAVRAVVRQR